MIKVLITIADAAAEIATQAPLAVAEIMDARKVSLARRAYGGPMEVIASDEFLAHLIAQDLRNRGLSYIYSELLGQVRGNELYLRECPGLVGARVSDVFAAFSTAVPIGVVRRRGGQFRALLGPAPDLVVAAGDRLVRSSLRITSALSLIAQLSRYPGIAAIIGCALASRVPVAF